MFPSFMLEVKTMIPLFPSIMFQIKTMLPLFPSIMFQVKTMINLFPSILFQIKTLLRGVERGRSELPVESLVNWVVSRKQGLNGRFDKGSRYETFGIRPHRPKKTKFNQEQTQTPESLLALQWKDKAADQEVKEFINESLKKNAQG
ncbi:hypothetical protein V6N12_002524 [Hibiscus sabdariffa]|uniref:Uncharacterized protein n=1 Tax=Hibiscus sabdariffa TaxID=183260 RepID=A0ABR2ASB6_9ROSI